MNIKQLITVGFLPDVHYPRHSLLAYNCAKAILAAYKPHILVKLGDHQDIACLASHDKAPHVAFMTLEQEVAPGIDLMHDLVKEAKSTKVVYLMGNHEWRIQRYAEKNAPHMANQFNVRKILGIPKGWITKDYEQGQHYKVAPGLVACHGSWHNKHAAAKALDMYGCSVVFGHTHRLQIHSRCTLEKRMVAWNLGWLGDPRTAGDYVKGVPDWQHAMGIAHANPKTGEYWMEVFHIQQGIAVSKGVSYGKRF